MHMLGIIVLVIILGIFGVVALVTFSTYNNLITLKNKVKEAQSDIDVQLKRRHDLIPNLIKTVEGAKNFESETLERVIKARQQAIDIDGFGEDKAVAENMLSGALRQLFAVSEAYPDLKSNQNFLSLQNELTSTEDRILSARRFYNSVVNDYNTQQDLFPAVLFKGLAGAAPAEYFELEDPETERKVPEVKF